MEDEHGASSLLLLAVLFFLSAAAIGTLIALGSVSKRVNTYTERINSRKKLETAARSVLEELGKDPTPESDSPFDPVWEYIKETNASHPEQLSLTDISSAINLNLVRTPLLEKTSLKNTASGKRPLSEFDQFRTDSGLITDLSVFSDFFNADTFTRCYTLYGYVNLNTSFEYSLERMFAARTGDTGAAGNFHSQIQGYLEKTALITKDQVRSLLGAHYDELYPLMNVEPGVNVNFAAPEVLYGILSYPYGEKKITNYEAIYNAITSERGHEELGKSYLADLIQVQGLQQLVLQYLGVRTWFWRISVESDSSRVELIVARIPDDTKVRFVILEDHYLKNKETRTQ